MPRTERLSLTGWLLLEDEGAHVRYSPHHHQGGRGGHPSLDNAASQCCYPSIQPAGEPLPCDRPAVTMTGMGKIHHYQETRLSLAQWVLSELL